MKDCDLMVMALFQKQGTCPSNKATTMCGGSADSVQLPTGLCNRVGENAENKARLSPTSKCRLTHNHHPFSVLPDKYASIHSKYASVGTPHLQ